MPESTGAALACLSGMVQRDAVLPSLQYLQNEVARLQTPISLGWSLLGLAAWKLAPPNAKALVERCLANQERYGEYETSALCLLVLGGLAVGTDAQNPLLPISMVNSVSATLSQ